MSDLGQFEKLVSEAKSGAPDTEVDDLYKDDEDISEYAKSIIKGLGNVPSVFAAVKMAKEEHIAVQIRTASGENYVGYIELINNDGIMLNTGKSIMIIALCYIESVLILTGGRKFFYKDNTWYSYS